MNPSDVKIEPWPPQPTTGMLTGEIPRAIRVQHLETGLVVICGEHRNQAANKAQALAHLATIVKHRGRL